MFRDTHYYLLDSFNFYRLFYGKTNNIDIMENIVAKIKH